MDRTFRPAVEVRLRGFWVLLPIAPIPAWIITGGRDGHVPSWFLSVAIGFGLLFVGWAIRVWNARVEVHARGIVAVNELRTHWVPWPDVLMFTVVRGFGGRTGAAELRDGSVLELRAIVTTNRRKLDWRVDEAVDELNSLLEVARARSAVV